MDQRLLTPVEATLLLAPTTSTAVKCVQAGLLSLLGADRIAFENSSSVFKQSVLVLNSPGNAEEGGLPRHLLVLEKALIDHGKGGRLAASEVLHALQKRFGIGFGRYLQDELFPGLVNRGLLTREDSKWLGLFPRVSFQRTSKGDALAAPLERVMQSIEELPSLRASAPQEAIRLARSAGVLLLMSSKARRQIPKLRKLIEQGGDGSTGLTYVAAAGDGGPERDGMSDFMDMGSAFDAHSLFEGLETVGDFTSGGDSSSSDGGDGGGGGGD